VADYPEHEKMAAKRAEIDVVTGFLEWLGSSDYLVVRVYSPASLGEPTNRLDECDWPSIERLLAEHFGISPDRLAAEKDAMLVELRRTGPAG
jgi:hypothetical protein